MNQFVTEQIIYVLRLVAAALCGGLIGCERQSKKKTAGTRTHVIIAVASAMMMIISKYGFGDVLNEYVKLDPSRVAAGVVTAIGFIGSGIIIFRNNSVNGITTSAGIWATVGVGMSMGAGMYILGAVSTAIVMLSELFLGRKGYFSRRNGEDKEVEIEYCESLDEDIFQFINRTLQDQNCKMVNIQLTEEASTYVLTAQLKTPADYDMSGLVGELKKKGQLKRISVQ